MDYWLYLLRCSDGSLYTGITTDFARRWDEHCSGDCPWSKYTRAHPPVAVAALWKTEGRSNASKGEIRIKRLSKQKKEELCRNPQSISSVPGLEAILFLPQDITTKTQERSAMQNGKWIWYPGDFETYHNMLLHSRREERGAPHPVDWHLPRPEARIFFKKMFTLEEPVTFTAVLQGEGDIKLDGCYAGRADVPFTVPAGKHEVMIRIQCLESFPALYIDGPLHTDETWWADVGAYNFVPACCDTPMTDPLKKPEIFPFEYLPLTPVSVIETDGGLLYDYGKETFGPIRILQTAENGTVHLVYGETRREALDETYAYVQEFVPAAEGERAIRPRAFRFIFTKAQNGIVRITDAKEEYLPLKDPSSFTCDDAQIAPILSVCRRTFELNSREFYLDGIKRDRWCWSGDAYQSFMVNRATSFDEGIVRRTIRCLLGKQPYFQHINRINDYSCYLIFSVWEHYFATGDTAFVQSVWTDVKALFRFITERLDEKTGYVVARTGDWIFIDWADFDRKGPLCAEQILLWHTYDVMARLCAVMGEPADFSAEANRLKTSILRDFWDEEQQAFFDSFESGKHNVTRHANIFAILYDFVDENTQKTLLNTVLNNETVPAITTPYFKFFELLALCKLGQIEPMQDYIDSYWGGMLTYGATTVWEEYFPGESVEESTAMYGKPFGRSHCHAWGSGPLALLPLYCVGIRPTDVAYRTFTVTPQPGRYRTYEATVPVKDGLVFFSYDHGKISVSATVEGGTLIWNGEETPIPARNK